MKLDGKVALVTGSSRGIGRAIAVRLARDGADVVVHYHGSADGARATLEEVEAAGRRAHALRADVGSPCENELQQLRPDRSDVLHRTGTTEPPVRPVRGGRARRAPAGDSGVIAGPSFDPLEAAAEDLALPRFTSRAVEPHPLRPSERGHDTIGRGEMMHRLSQATSRSMTIR